MLYDGFLERPSGVAFAGLAWCALVAAGCTASVQRSPAMPGAVPRAEAAAEPAGRVNAHLLVSPDWVERHLSAHGLVLLHVGADRSAFEAGHLPGARFLPVGALLTSGGGVLNELPPVATLDSVFESLGVGDNGRIVVYGPPLAAARTFFTLDYLGHGERVALLDGGLEHWKAGGRPVTGATAAHARADFTPRPRHDVVVDAAWVADHLPDPGVVLLDARPAAQFSGAEPGDGVTRPGHIPGAANLFWERLLVSVEDPRLQDVPTLRKLFADAGAGASPSDTVVAYCRTGMQASYAYFVARYLGYPARMYDGSFVDWSRHAELPVER